MKITVLVDNSTLIDRYFQAEPGLSFLIEDGSTHILFDCGYSDLFIRNAHRMGLKLTDLDYVVLSHGHLDHSWGLTALIRFMTEERLEGRSCKRPTLVTHPLALQGSVADGIEIGPLLTRETLSRHFDLCLTAAPNKLTPRLTYLGEIPRGNDFEACAPIGHKEDGKADFLPDDSGIVYEGRDGLVMITGCSHAGICNMLTRARHLTGTNCVQDIIGGLHLLDASVEVLEKTSKYLEQLQPRTIHPCHCTDLAAKIALARTLPVQEVGVGLVLEFQ